MDEEDDGYKKFYACAFKIENIIKNLTNKAYDIYSLIEISIENEPTLITLHDRSIIWRKNWYKVILS